MCKKDKLFSMFVLADIHIGSKRNTNFYFNAGLKNMINLDSDAKLIINGDLTTSGKIEDWHDFFDLLNNFTFADRLITLGNHDVRGPNHLDWTNDELENPTYFIQNTLPNYRTDYLSVEKAVQTNNIFFAYKIDGYNFIFLNAEKGLKDSTYLSEKQLSWLDNELTLSEKRGLKSIIVVHQPLKDTVHDSNVDGGFGDEDQAMKEILLKHTNVVVMSGHIHNGFYQTNHLVKDYADIVDIPAYAVSEYGDGGKGLGYYCEFYDKKIIFEAWDFYLNKHLKEHDFVIEF